MYCSAALVELARVAALEHLAEARDLAQRLLEVVRGDVGELLELGVRALERERLGAGCSASAARTTSSSRTIRSRIDSTSLPEGARCRSGRRARSGGRSAPPATARTCVGEPPDRPRDDLAADHGDGQRARPSSTAGEHQGSVSCSAARSRGRRAHRRARPAGRREARERGAHGIEARLALGDGRVVDGAGAVAMDPLDRRLRVARAQRRWRAAPTAQGRRGARPASRRASASSWASGAGHRRRRVGRDRGTRRCRRGRSRGRRSPG